MAETLSPPVHAFDPAMAPDSEFEPGQLLHLAPGNEGRMLDRRRTPVRVVEIRPATGQWVCEVMAFEDQGAHWTLPLERVGSYQFARGARRAGPSALRQMRLAVRKFDRPDPLPANRRRLASTRRTIEKLRREVAAWLRSDSQFIAASGTLDLHARQGHPLLIRDLESFLRARDLGEIEHELAATLVSHPGSGEMLQGHARALAGLGLADYHGKVARDPAALAGPWAIEHRERHIVARLAFLRELFATVGIAAPVLYRAVSSEGTLAPRPPASFVHATFALEVAMSRFGPEWEGRAARLERQNVPVERLFMTYLETGAMNRQFREAEAVLIAEPANPMF